MADGLEGIRDARDQGTTPGTVPTTMDGTQNGPVVNGPLEGNPEAGPAPSPAAPAAPDPNEPATKQALAQKIAERRFKDSGRAAIYERRDSMTLEERQELENLDEESAAILDAQAGHARAATVSQSPLAPSAPSAPTAAPAPAAPGAPAPVATNGNRYKLSVYGVEQEVDEAEVIQHGIQALQKQHAADVRMRDAATYEARLNAYAADLQRYADDIARRAQTAPTQAQAGTPGNAAPTSPGVAAAVDPATVRQALEAMENLDSAKAAELMQKAISDALAQGRATPTAPAPVTPPPTLGEVPRLQPAASDPWGEDQRVGANKVFNSEFAHFTDAQFNAAREALNDAMADPANRGVKLENLVRTVCRTTARLMPASAAPAPQPVPVNPVQGELESRRVLKARIPVTPPAAMGRAPSAAAPEVQFESPSAYVQRLRQRSGSNSTR